MSLDNNSILLNNILTKVNNLPNAGVSLNFTVVGGTTQPNNPAENTIWVNTSTTISGWVISPIEPTSPAPNSVWIRVGSDSNAMFNAIKNNGIELYHISAKQYISGAWIDKTVKSWQNGIWADWIIYVYNNGVLFNQSNPIIKTTDTSSSVTFGSNSITMICPLYKYCYLSFATPIDFSNFSTLTVKYRSKSAYADAGSEKYHCGVRVLVANDTANWDWSEPSSRYLSGNANTDYTLTVDVTTVNSMKYINILCSVSGGGSGGINIEISSITLK